jgi:hypothetical protein
MPLLLEREAVMFGLRVGVERMEVVEDSRPHGAPWLIG